MLRSIGQMTMLVDAVIAAVEQNLPVTDALRFLARDAKGTFQSKLNSALSLAEEGIPLGEALREQGSYFSAPVCNMLSAGEKYGNMKRFAGHLRGIYSDLVTFVRTMAVHLQHPVAMTASLVCVVLVVLPTFSRMFEELLEELGFPLPPLTDFVLRHGAKVVVPLALILVAAAFVLIFSGTLSSMLRQKLKPMAAIADRVAICLPYLGGILRKMSYAQFSHSVGALLQCGMPLHEAAEVSFDMDLNLHVKKQLEAVHASLSEGKSFGEGLRAAGAPEEVCWFAETGEGTKALAENMMRVANLYRSQVAAALRGSGKVIVPLIMIPIGILFGVLIIALWWPLLVMIEAFEVS